MELMILLYFETIYICIYIFNIYIFYTHATQQQVVQEGDVTDEITTHPPDDADSEIQEVVTVTTPLENTTSISTTCTATCNSSYGNHSADLDEAIDTAGDVGNIAGAFSAPEQSSCVEDPTRVVVASLDKNHANELVDVEMGVPASDDTLELEKRMPVVVVAVVANDSVEECESGYLSLPCQRQVPNCCAICLCQYEVAETVIWSNNMVCQHAFHEECIVEWLLKQQEGTPCPCCRREFITNLSSEVSEVACQKPVDWATVISFR